MTNIGMLVNQEPGLGTLLETKNIPIYLNGPTTAIHMGLDIVLAASLLRMRAMFQQFKTF